MLWITLLTIPFLVILFFLIFGVVYGAPWVPTSKKTVHKMLSMVDVKAGDVLYDLGSGDGRIITMAAEEFHATSVGWT